MICAIVLAAGRSRRMGVQKLLLPLGGQPVIARVADAWLGGPVDRVFAVVGRDGDRIAEALAGRPIQFVVNPQAEGEMLSSVRCGLRAMPDECAVVLVVLGDQPGVTADVVAATVRAFRADGRGIVVPTCRGRRGHPLLFAAHYRDEILNQYEDAGLRGLLLAHPADVCEVEVAMPGVLEDIDVPEDYRQMIARRQADSSEQRNSE
jgi:molybdenum cofactor cytidylyltransferase